MSSIGWQGRLDEASTKEDVVSVVNDFLVLWTREDIALLPADCKPRMVDNADEVNTYALKLARGYTFAIGEVSPMHRMASFFTKAALRMFQIEEVFRAVQGDKGEGGRMTS
jgi:hypothetical protein